MVRRRPDDGPDKVARDQDGRRLTVTDQAVVDTLVERIVAGFQPASILLFGSRARGTDNRWSDVDLLVVMDEVEDKRRAAVEMGRALGDLSVSKDIVVTTHEEIARRGHVVGSVLRAAQREGKVVYERP
ncbi:MAG: nucleotidyltransferase domain-containing protein [Caldilineaceae bacterium]|nr:nucleotidyltransferase domain-containing protein [Caldilineaceae bacterium]